MILQIVIKTNIVLLFLCVGFILLIAAIYFLIKYIKLDERNSLYEEKYNELENKVKTLQLETIDSKLNPHLFKNILNSIQSHAYQTYFALDKLASVLDYILYESRKKFVTPKNEIDFALNLIEINKIKISPLFELKVKTKINESEALYEQELLPPMISIDLIENAFKHADLQTADAFISFTFEFKDGCFILTVANKISSKPTIKKEKGGIGISTFEQRLNLLYKGCYNYESFVENDVYISHLKINLYDYKAKMFVAR